MSNKIFEDDILIQSLKNSKMRIVVLVYLSLVHPPYVNLKQISSALKVDPSNILGALMGSGKRYSPELSLVNLGLVDRIETDLDGHKLIHYTITPKGVKIADQLKNEPMTSVMLGNIENIKINNNVYHSLNMSSIE